MYITTIKVAINGYITIILKYVHIYIRIITYSNPKMLMFKTDLPSSFSFKLLLLFNY